MGLPSGSEGEHGMYFLSPSGVVTNLNVVALSHLLRGSNEASRMSVPRSEPEYLNINYINKIPI